jgi:hypothetical protein
LIKNPVAVIPPAMKKLNTSQIRIDLHIYFLKNLTKKKISSAQMKQKKHDNAKPI